MNFTPLWTAALNAFSNFIIVDEHCRIAYMNKPYTEILNVQLEDVIGKPIKKCDSDHETSGSNGLGKSTYRCLNDSL